MKLNQRIFDYSDEENLIEKQDLENHSVEIYRLNPYEDLLYEFTNKGKFAVWSSIDGSNYKLYVEDGYYEKLKPLYQSKINKIWLEFWDGCEKITSKFRNIIMPLAFVVILLVFGSSYIIKNNHASIGIALGAAATYFIGVMAYKRVVNKKIGDLNKLAVGEIKKILGEKRFANLLEMQRSYIDEYFKYEDEVEDENSIEESSKDNEVENVSEEEKQDLGQNEENNN